MAQIKFPGLAEYERKLSRLSRAVKDEIAANYPAYTAAPPTDDARPNETTWTAFRKWIDARPKAPSALSSTAH